MMKKFEVYYREKGNKNANVTSYTVDCKTKAEARRNFKEEENPNNKWTIVKIEETY